MEKSIMAERTLSYVDYMNLDKRKLLKKKNPRKNLRGF